MKTLARVERTELQTAIAEAIRANPDVVKDYLAGKQEALHFLVGKVMQLTDMRADPREIIKLLRAELGRKS